MKITRRALLKAGAATAVSLIIPIQGCAAIHPTFSETSSQNTLEDQGYIQIFDSGRVLFVLPRDEMGQGVYHGLTTLIAEELGLMVDNIEVVFAPVHSDYVNTGYGVQGTWGSSSMREHFLPLRQAAANMRDTLIRAASQKLEKPKQEITLDQGFIHHDSQRFPMGEFVALATTLTPSKNASLSRSDSWKIIGKDQSRADILAKVTGQTQYGIDVNIPNTLKATVIHAPTNTSHLISVDDANALEAEGVVGVFKIDKAVAIVAHHFHQALSASKLLNIHWSESDDASFNSSDMPALLAKTLSSDDGVEIVDRGQPNKIIEKASIKHKAQFYAPYLTHMAMEPMNCTVRIDGEHCDIWVGTQSPEFARNGVAEKLGLDRDAVRIHNQFMGGGFGRRVGIDYILEATEIAREIKSPIQVIWTREEDTQHDYYRPPSLVEFEGSVDSTGKISAMTVKRAGPNILPSFLTEALPAILPAFVPKGLASFMVKSGQRIVDNWVYDRSSVEGLFEDYHLPHLQVDHFTQDPGIRTGYWRSVGHSHHGFFIESFIDELAYLANADPVQFRMDNLADEKLKNTLAVAAKEANWSRGVSNGNSLGVAIHRCFGTTVAQIAEVSVTGSHFQVKKVVCAVDCGIAVNPDNIRAQMEGGIIFALSAALHGKVDFANGRVKQSNFHDQPVARMNDAPDIKVCILPSDEKPTGVGEPGVPPLAAAVGNALFRATGQRLRQLPLRLSAT